MIQIDGGSRRFGATGSTTRQSEVWRLWTTPATWADWDRGLASAHLEGPFQAGARGELVDLSGRTSEFVVDEVLTMRRCRYHVVLPGARLVLDRTLDSPLGVVRHDVAFHGALAPVWALVLGRGFRRQLPPTLEALLAAADASDR